jgi:nitrogenase-associated protein
MAIIDFYEKPGCINNTKQRKMLEMYGHQVSLYSIISNNWDTATLRTYFGNMPVVDWFNPSAPRIKNGEIKPNEMNEKTALEAMIIDPLLIRRPLIKIGDIKIAGFDNELVNNLLQHHDVSSIIDCPNKDNRCQ